jgi:hypothetical protein
VLALVVLRAFGRFARFLPRAVRYLPFLLSRDGNCSVLASKWNLYHVNVRTTLGCAVMRCIILCLQTQLRGRLFWNFRVRIDCLCRHVTHAQMDLITVILDLEAHTPADSRDRTRDGSSADAMRRPARARPPGSYLPRARAKWTRAFHLARGCLRTHKYTYV